MGEIDPLRSCKDPKRSGLWIHETAGFGGLLIPVQESESGIQPFDLIEFLGDSRDQTIPHCPAYPAGSAGYIALGRAMSDFWRITEHDDRAKLSEEAARHEALLQEALGIAKLLAQAKSQLVREIIATGVVEGLASNLQTKAAAVSFRAEKYKRTWHSLTPWQYLENTTAGEQAESMIQTVEDNIQMTESTSWPLLPEGEEGMGEMQ